MKNIILLLILVVQMGACGLNGTSDKKQAEYKVDSVIYNMHRAVELEHHKLEPVYVKPDLDIYSEGDTVRVTLENNLILPANSAIEPSSPVVLGKFIKTVKLPSNIVY